jgi:cytochrome P450
MLPNYLFEELKDLPDEQLSARQSAHKVLNGDYTGLGSNPPLAGAVMKELFNNVDGTLAILQDEINYAVEEGIGSCPDWTPVVIWDKLLRIVALSSGRVLVGRPLSRDEEWIYMVKNYTADAIKACQDVLSVPRLVRPVVVPFLKSIRNAKNYRIAVAAKLKPQLQDMVEAHRKMVVDDDNSYFESLPDDFHSLAVWSLGHYPAGQIPTTDSVAITVLSGIFAATHTMNVTLTNIMFDLACHPEYAAVLREEIETVSAEEPNGKFRKKSMPKLKKLDSFIKESQRMNPIGSAVLLRLVTAPNGITLSNGDYLPRGTTICVPPARHTSAIDAKYLSPLPPMPSLDEFHPWRFSDLREHKGQENKHHFVTTSKENTIFGHGRWACPGRFYAANEIKSIVIELLRRYDIALGPAGQAEGGEFKRPMTFNIEMAYIPDPTATIYFKDREI